MYEWHGWATLRKTPEVDTSTTQALLAESDRISNETGKLTKCKRRMARLASWLPQSAQPNHRGSLPDDRTYRARVLTRDQDLSPRVGLAEDAEVLE
jgi:hypothetical protein